LAHFGKRTFTCFFCYIYDHDFWFKTVNNQDEFEDETEEENKSKNSLWQDIFLWSKNFPVTAIAIIISIILFLIVRIVSFRYDLFHAYLLTGARLNVLESSIDIWNGQLWRLFINLFHHGNFMHIAFNCFWLHYFGSLCERFLGLKKYLLFFILCGIFQATICEITFEKGAIGLSGIIYGLFGFLIMVREKDNLINSLITPQLIKGMIVLLFVSIGLTLFKIMNIANVGHFSGLIFGLLYGFCFYQKKNIFRTFLFWLIMSGIIPGLFYAYHPSNDPFWQEWNKSYHK